MVFFLFKKVISKWPPPFKFEHNKKKKISSQQESPNFHRSYFHLSSPLHSDVPFKLRHISECTLWHGHLSIVGV